MNPRLSKRSAVIAVIAAALVGGAVVAANAVSGPAVAQGPDAGAASSVNLYPV